jgi:hypothetical protein
MKKYWLPGLVFTVLGLTACRITAQADQKAVSVEPFQSATSIQAYLQTHVASIGFGGKPGTPHPGKLQPGTGTSFPVLLVVEKSADGLKVVSHQMPRDGALYVEDMNTLFSERFRKRLRNETTATHNQRVKKLQDEINQAAGVS